MISNHITDLFKVRVIASTLNITKRVQFSLISTFSAHSIYENIKVTLDRYTTFVLHTHRNLTYVILIYCILAYCIYLSLNIRALRVFKNVILW